MASDRGAAVRTPCAVLVLVLGLLPTVVTADSDARPDAAATRLWHTGLNLRTDIGPHRLRVGGGVGLGRLDLTVVLDPKVFIDNKQNDTDVLVEYSVLPGAWAALLGWRASSVAIDRGRQWQEHLLAGVSGALPRLWEERIRGRFGIELEVTVVRHGGGFETDWVSLASDRHMRDLTSFNLFLRLEYARGF